MWAESPSFKYDKHDKGDYEKMRQHLSIDWTQHLHNIDVQASLNNLQTKIKEAALKYIPSTPPIRRNKEKQTNMDGWKFPDKIRDKKKPWRTYSTSRQESDRQKYVKARNQATWSTLML
jgi:hypothetical protein